METMIDLIDVTKSYGKGLPAVNHANLHVDKGEFVFVVGSSGSGKSTLIKLLMKELDSTSGQMIVSGERLEKMKHRRVSKYRRKLGVVFQDFRLLKDRNVYENVAFAQRVVNRPTRVIRKRVPEVLQEVGLAVKYKSFPDELSGDALLERIYREMEHYRPFEHRRSDGTYNRSLLGRAAWYMEQDDLTLGEKNAQFLKLFHEEDQRAVEDWICRNRAEEPYTVPRRDRKSTLLYAVLDRARANGDLREIEPIWDYYLPNKNEPLSPDKDSYLTNYAFSAVSTIDFGCEGIYVELFLEGQFDESGNDRCSIGTFKTLRDDAEACRLMGQLCGVLMYHTAKYVNENLHRYTPKRELEAELHRKSAVFHVGMMTLTRPAP